MFNEAIKQIKIAIIFLLLLSVLTGLIYPVLITGIAQLLFPWKANGSFIRQNENVIGSLLIGQSFADAKYFWSRPSATPSFPYNAASSSGSNLGPSNPDFLVTMKQRASKIKKSDLAGNRLIPVDLVTASGSGLDPEISPEAAFYQVSRIAQTRGLNPQAIEFLIKQSIKKRFLSILGEPRVNVLEINLALDRLSTARNFP